MRYSETMTFLQNSFICNQSLFSLIPSALWLKKGRVKNGSEISLLCIKKNLVFKWWIFVFHTIATFSFISGRPPLIFVSNISTLSSVNPPYSHVHSVRIFMKNIVLAAKRMTYTYSKGNIHWYAYIFKN